ncbi:unnamed protein product [Polarella glacialis]|uniref:Uncharacterized protein n=1 Tax=Polarella glacialis TaxID=89957 RepID=A0A813FZ02_POLGL|nr:unnamed protein product [Polarella glacialis]
MEQMLGRRRGAPPSAGGGPRKVRVHEQKNEPSKIELASAKLLLTLASNIRQHDACLLHTLILPAQHSVSTAMDTAGKEYFLKKQRSKGEASSLPPYLHAWCAAILAASSLKDIPEGDRAVLVQDATSTNKPEMFLDHVFRC